MVSHFRYALSRNSSIHSGSLFLAEIARTTSSSSPFGKVSLSMIVFQPALYGLQPTQSCNVKRRASLTCSSERS